MSANGLWGHYYIYCDSAGFCAGSDPSNWGAAGGTSFASPIIAGIQALVNQHVGSAQGNPNPVLYSLAASEYGPSGNSSCFSQKGVASTCIFYDVVRGDNDVNCTGTVNCYLPSAISACCRPATPGTSRPSRRIRATTSPPASARSTPPIS